jgi:hypothetical protein
VDTESTVKHVLDDYFAPADTEANDSAEHRLIRKLTKEPMDTGDDKTFTQEEVASVIKKLKSKKVHGEDRLTGEIISHVFRSFSSFMTELYM